MRPESNNPLDLNNLPEDYTTRDGTSSSAGGGGGYRKKKSGGAKDDGEGDGGKVYECRFCSLKFCKSQALGGHMNRHRQERETETLNKARQLVFTNDLAPGHLGYVSGGGQPISHMGDPFRSMYPTRLFPTSPPIMPQPPPPQPPAPPPAPAPYMYTSPPPRLLSFHSQYPPPPANDYFMGHVISEGNYTCIGAPVGPSAGFVSATGGGSGGVRDASMNSQEEGLSWGRR